MHPAGEESSHGLAQRSAPGGPRFLKPRPVQRSAGRAREKVCQREGKL